MSKFKVNGETWFQWARRTFEFEYCAECGKDVEGHVEGFDPFGNWFAWCKQPEKQ